MFILNEKEFILNEKEFICPHCKKATGWREVTPIHGHYSVCYDENGYFFCGGLFGRHELLL